MEKSLSVKKLAFTLAEVLVAKRERGEMSLLNLFRTRELKEPSKRFMKQCAFTLAEVLITLGIIGVVAAMTIPTLMNNFQTKATVTSLKEVYSLTNQAFSMAVTEDGTPDAWFTLSNSDDDNQVMIEELAKYLKVVKKCSQSGEKGCFPANRMYLNLNKTNYGILDNDGYAIQLSNGMFLSAGGSSGVGSPTCALAPGASKQLQNWCASFLIDINGYKEPNQYGKDLFSFYITKNGLVPTGISDDTWNPFVGNCTDGAGGLGTGGGCAAWILYNENMDYLKCSSTISWNGPTSCN